MARKKYPLPEVGELVISTIAEIQSSHVYMILDEYRGDEKDGLDRSNFRVSEDLKTKAVAYMHISEISNSWIKNIREHVKEGQKIITRVLRIDNRMVVVSKRRVSDSDRKRKLNEFKRSNRAEGLLFILGERLKVSIDELYQKIGFPLEEYYGGDLWSAFEDIKEEGIAGIMDLEFTENIEQEWLDELEKLVESNVEIPHVTIIGEFELTCYKPNGVEAIKEALMAGEKSITKKDGAAEISFQLIASPRYRVQLDADDYQTGENLMKKVEAKVLKTIKKLGGQGSFIR